MLRSSSISLSSGNIILCMVFCILLSPVLTGRALAGQCHWVETTGEAVVENITPYEAKRLALKRARLKAIEGISPVDVNAATIIKNNAFEIEFINTLTQGYILKEEIVGWEADTVKDAKGLPINIYTVRLKSCVVDTAPGDPFFKVTATLNKTTFTDGEEAEIRIKCTKDCYLSIVNITADGRIRLLLPNRYQSSPFIKAGTGYVFPSDGLALEIHTLEGYRENTEFFYIIATKEEFKTLSVLEKDGIVSSGDFFGALASLPADRRAEAILSYSVTRSY